MNDEIDKLRFGEQVLQILKESIVAGCTDLDLDEIADLAVELGLMTRVSYDPELHSHLYDDYNYDAGDRVYYWET